MASPTYNVIICKHEPESIQEMAVTSSILIPAFEDLAHDLGDYYIGNWVLERKDARDFISSLIDGRLFDQARKLAQLPSDYKKAFIIEGNTSYHAKFHHMTPEHINGAINALLMEYNIPCFKTSSKKKTIGLLEKLVTLETNPFDILTVVRHKGIGKLSLSQQQELVLQGFPGIGIERAKLRLRNYDTLRGALKEILQYTPNDDNKLALKIAELLDHLYGSEHQ